MTQNQFNFKTPPSFKGVYEAYNSVPNIGKGQKSERWFKRIESQLHEYRNTINSKSNPSPPRPSDLPFLCSISNCNSIVDFGGSSGWLWDYIKFSNINNTIHSYNIIETEEVCQFAISSKFHQPPVEYFTMDKFEKNSDIFYCNSVLQYFDDESFIINFIKKTNSNLILLEDLYLGNFNDFYSSQIYYEDRIPVKFRNKKKFINLFKNNGYELLLIKPYICEHRGIVQPLPMSGFPEEKKIEYASTVLLKKIIDK